MCDFENNFRFQCLEYTPPGPLEEGGKKMRTGMAI